MDKFLSTFLYFHNCLYDIFYITFFARRQDILMAGSPGSGKTLLARALPGILPEMSIEESLDVRRIYSVADQLPAGTPLIPHLPFRAPHHTISHTGLVGGGVFRNPVRFPSLIAASFFSMNSPSLARASSK